MSGILQDAFQLSCPVPHLDQDQVLMAHGGGGRLMAQLIEGMFLPAFDNAPLNTLHDGAVVETAAGRLAFSTDSYVVQPLFFPGGDIGSMAVSGTANDLAMCGARPLYLSVGFILEEGLAMDTLKKVVESMRRAADEAELLLVTGDTKVVDKGRGDGIYINTAGIGRIEGDWQIGPDQIGPGDQVLLSGDIGRHGMAVMAMREGLQFESAIESDCACVADLVMELLAAGVNIHCLRDLTRGGLASALVEIAETSGKDIAIEEGAIPVLEEVRGACELLGLDPLYVANEGRFIAFVDRMDADRALAIMRDHPLGRDATCIGTVGAQGQSLVTLKSRIGVSRIIDRLSGEQLPRIC